ncbi:MAG: T9SS type A sorting domain-containing protein [Candidatus Cloacimonadales bacterium]|nr:T9SS type A sorting domain-containing protein [Candidatus Cloacimonadales bacterium]
MRKLMWIFVLVGLSSLMYATNFQGSIATTDWSTYLAVLQDDNTTGVPDGWLCQIMIPGVNGAIDPPNTDGTPGGDDLLCNGGGNNIYQFTWDSSWTEIQGCHYLTSAFLWRSAGEGTEPCANVGENFYLRLFNSTTVGGSTKYLNSALWLLAASNDDLCFTSTANWDYGTNFNWQLLAPDPSTWDVSGTVTLDGVGLEGVSIDYQVVGSEVRSHYSQKTKKYTVGNSREIVATDANGYYSFTADNGVEYIAVPTLEGYTFTPENRQAVISADISNWDFVATVNGTGSGGSPAVIPITPINFGGGLIEPGLTIDPQGTGDITVDVVVDNSASNPGAPNTDLSFQMSFTGAIAGQTFSFILNYTGLSPIPTYVFWWNGSAWIAPVNVVFTSPTVAFDITFPAGRSRDGSTEIILGDDDPLPVTLSSFTASYSKNSVILNWVTQLETDNLGWNLYRSNFENGYPNGNYLSLNSTLIDGMGTTTEPTNYNFTDEYPVIEGRTYWYWLQSVSTTNELELFGPVSLEIPIAGQLPTMTILNSNYPNPFNPETTITFSIKENEIGILSIYNLRGEKIVKERFEAGNHQYHWKAEGLASGIYFYKLDTPTNNMTRKMMLMK